MQSIKIIKATPKNIFPSKVSKKGNYYFYVYALHRNTNLIGIYKYSPKSVPQIMLRLKKLIWLNAANFQTVVA